MTNRDYIHNATDLELIEMFETMTDFNIPKEMNDAFCLACPKRSVCGDVCRVNTTKDQILIWLNMESENESNGLISK